MIPSDRLDRLDRLLAEGRLLRGQWTDGHERACLLAALSPEVAASGSARRCPAELMPPWLARLTPWLDDEPSAEAWPAIVRRYASLARRWHVLDAAAWERARVGALVAIVVEARSHVAADWTSALVAVDGVLSWLRAGAPEAQREALLQRPWAASSPVAYAAASSASPWMVESAARLASRSAGSEAADRIAAGVLDSIEREVEAAR